MKPVCYIIGAGDTCEKDFEYLINAGKQDMIIAADGGYTALSERHIVPDLVVGDFDSCAILPENIPASIPVRRLIPEKDFTDVHTCVDEGISKGFQHFVLLGCTGGRMEHTLANIQLMSGLATKGYSVRMYGTEQIYDVICNNRLTLPARTEGYVSVFSLSDTAACVTIQGLKYPLDGTTLTNTFALGVSNEFVGTKGLIEVKTGCLLILWSRF